MTVYAHTCACLSRENVNLSRMEGPSFAAATSSDIANREEQDR